MTDQERLDRIDALRAEIKNLTAGLTSEGDQEKPEPLFEPEELKTTE